MNSVIRLGKKDFRRIKIINSKGKTRIENKLEMTKEIKMEVNNGTKATKTNLAKDLECSSRKMVTNNTIKRKTIQPFQWKLPLKLRNSFQAKNTNTTETKLPISSIEEIKDTSMTKDRVISTIMLTVSHGNQTSSKTGSITRIGSNRTKIIKAISRSKTIMEATMIITTKRTNIWQVPRLKHFILNSQLSNREILGRSIHDNSTEMVVTQTSEDSRISMIRRHHHNKPIKVRDK